MFRSRDHSRDYSSSLPKESVKNIDPSTLKRVQPSDMVRIDGSCLSTCFKDLGFELDRHLKSSNFV